MLPSAVLCLLLCVSLNMSFVSQRDLHMRFQEAYPNIRVSLRCFEGLKPYFVRKLKDRNTCCCEYHVQLVYFKEAFNQMRHGRYGLHGTSCFCKCLVCRSYDGTPQCRASNATFPCLVDLWESVLCPKAIDSAYHNRKCLLGTCKHCGIERLSLCPSEQSDDSSTMTVKLFDEVLTQEVDEKGNQKSRKNLVVQQVSPMNFISLLQSKLGNFIKHNYVYRWQAQQFKECLENFPDDVVVSVVDFAENYSFKVQNEIQSMHWYSTQVTILVHISYLRDALGAIQKTTHFYISDDKTHDTLFVQHCFLLHNDWLKSQGYSVKRHWVWSDGAASQFKARRPFYFVARFFNMTGIEMMHNFFASGHGKGEHDGAGAVIKRALTHEQLKSDGWVLHNASSVVAYLNATIKKQCPQTGRKLDRSFWEVKLGDVDRYTEWDCVRIKGSRSFHCVNGYNQLDMHGLRRRLLSCYCYACIKGQWRRCANKDHVEGWEYLQIQPTGRGESDGEASSEDEDEHAPIYAGHHDELSDALMVGQNFAVNAEEQSADFYILKCTKAKRLTIIFERDEWHNSIKKNSFVVEGLFYDKVNGRDDTYVLLDSKPSALIYSHLVRCIRFPMSPRECEPNVYDMSNDVFEQIYNSMPPEENL